MLDKKAIKEFWEKYELKIVLLVGFILVSAISFEFGLIQGKKGQDSPLIIEKFTQGEAGPVLGQNADAKTPSASTPGAQKTAQEAKITPTGSTIPTQNCQFVGSKNSNKYHLPTCRWSKQIKPENIVCFASAEVAASKGYLPDKGCVK